jgi:uncharacterized membrane protein
MICYLLLRNLSYAIGLNLCVHPAMVSPLVATMAEAAAHKNRPPLDDKEKQDIRALAAMSENFGNFFSQLIFIGAGGLLLIKGVFDDSGYVLNLSDMYPWALPTAFASFCVFVITARLADGRRKKHASQKAEK